MVMNTLTSYSSYDTLTPQALLFRLYFSPFFVTTKKNCDRLDLLPEKSEMDEKTKYIRRHEIRFLFYCLTMTNTVDTFFDLAYVTS